MQCPKCDSRAYIKDSRMNPDGSRNRRYHCEECKHRFNSVERIDGAELPKSPIKLLQRRISRMGPETVDALLLLTERRVRDAVD